MNTPKVVNVLGVEYVILQKTEEEEPYLKECDGFCDRSRKLIIIAVLKPNPDKYQIDLEWYTRNVLRHEIIHAFLSESGLEQNTSDTDAWARNEEMVDWIAIQSPRILKAFQEVDCL